MNLSLVVLILCLVSIVVKYVTKERVKSQRKRKGQKRVPCKPSLGKEVHTDCEEAR